MASRARACGFVSALGLIGACVGDSTVQNDAGPDATMDAIVNDTAANDATDAGGPFCAGNTHTFCEDFDSYNNITSLVAAWQGTMVNNGATLSYGTGLSPPNSLLSMATGPTPLGGQHIWVEHAPFTQAATTQITLEYDLKVDSAALTGVQTAGFAAVVLGTSILTDLSVYLYVDASGLGVAWSPPADAGALFHPYSLSMMPAMGAWAGRWGVVVSMTTGALEATHNGTVVGTSTSTIPAALLKPSAITVAAGVNFVGASSSATIEIDNLTLDIQ